MKVTSVSLNIPFNRGKGRFRAYAKVVFDNVLLVTGIMLFESKLPGGEIERFIRFPDRQPPLSTTGGEYVSIAVVNTTDEALRQNIIDTVFAEYDKHPKNPNNKRRVRKESSNPE